MALFRCKSKYKEKVIYYGTVANMSINGESRYNGVATTTVGNYALFVGGHVVRGTGGYSENTVDYYDKSLVHGKATNMNHSRNYFAATTINNYALFVGGYNMTPLPSWNIDVTDYCDKSLVWSIMYGALQPYYLAATTVGNYALFAGGSLNFSVGNNKVSNKVQSFDASLTYSSAVPNMTYNRTGRNGLAATTIGNYALFSYGIISSPLWGAEYYDTSLTHGITVNVMNSKFNNVAATTVGNYALFSGGGRGITDVYDKSLTYSVVSSRYAQTSNTASTTIGNYALFKLSTGKNGYCYDASLTYSDMPQSSLNTPNCLGATTVGNYAIFGYNNIQAMAYTIG